MFKSIIVEGFDNMGKSTLIKVLREELDMDGYIAGGPPKTQKEARDRCREQMALAPMGIVYDRCTPISDMCYTFPNENEGLFDHTREYLLKYCIVIFCSTEWEESTHEVKEHDTEEHLAFIEENRDAICNRYNELMAAIKEDGAIVLTYDWRNDDVVHLVENIRKIKDGGDGDVTKGSESTGD